MVVASARQDLGSVAAAGAFTDRFKHHATSGQAVQHTTFSANAAASFDNVAHTAASQGDPLIFLAGDDRAAVALAQAVRRVNAASGTARHILVGSAAAAAAL